MGLPEIRAYYDAEIDLLMVELPHGDVPPADSERLARDVFLDVEAEGAPLVLEVLRASRHYPAEWLRRMPAAPDEPGPAGTRTPTDETSTPLEQSLPAPIQARPPQRVPASSAAPGEAMAMWMVGPRSLRSTRRRALAGG